MRDRQIMMYAVRYPERLDDLRALGADLTLQSAVARRLWDKIEELGEESPYHLDQREKNFWTSAGGLKPRPATTATRNWNSCAATWTPITPRRKNRLFPQRYARIPAQVTLRLIWIIFAHCRKPWRKGMSNLKDIQQIQSLIAKGKGTGFLTFEEVNKALPVEMSTPEQFEEIIGIFEQLEIVIVDSEKDGKKFPPPPPKPTTT